MSAAAGSARHVGAVGVMAEQCLARSPRGVAVAAAPTAAHLAASVLVRGGNAFDAAVTAALAETVLLPPKCGLAGDLVALVWEPGASAPDALLAIGGAPAGLGAVADRMTETGPLSVGVPGAPAGYLALSARGRFDLAEHAAPAIDLARDGFCWSTICTVLAEESRDLVHAHQDAAPRYYPGGAAIAPGTITTLPGLAAALERLVADRDRFLTGDVGRAVASRVAEAGGVLTLDDMSTASAEWVSPTPAEVAGARLFATPAPTHGPSLLDALGRLDLAAPAPPGPAAVRRAIAAAVDERRRSLTDPSGTSMVSAADADGTLVTIVHSNSYPRFGSGLIVDEYDLILANRAGRGFTAEPGHPNFPSPGRRPATTLHAWGWAAPAGWRVLGGTPGGVSQMPWNAQSLARLVGRPDVAVRDLATAIVAPRWQFDADGGVSVEDGLDPADVAELEADGGSVRALPRWATRAAMQIVADVGVAGGGRVGAVDPRTVGAALPV